MERDFKLIKQILVFALVSNVSFGILSILKQKRGFDEE
jgi:hypothetical protein